ncbi:DUF1961 family protein [Paenibacillus qinlingensis]|uniref:DUF1961 domain-containing protein n=1 Tax=Paenibacillus qinlingensis TaxID=1837343 RepID=A0ABU1NYI1_9BACL|nr:DUF1961 family protein [Paenibacillus qinlingensis]MDR6552535.1 hypothetical protein [Paenibacillus qinlingensis]
MIPTGWKCIYQNPLSSPQEVESFRMEGDGAVSFPMGRMRLEATRGLEDDYKANIVYWCPEIFPADVAITWEFWPIREPGLAILFFAAEGMEGYDLFDPSLPTRTGEYDQYHHGKMNALHVSYFRRRYASERAFHTCNLRKSYGFHLVMQGADPIPDVADAVGPYRITVLKQGPRVTFTINDLPVFVWEDPGTTYGPILGEGRIGFRQMTPLIAEYTNLAVYAP